ncbi:RagB/SusD family nutrient uptake outer membrane protein [Albibacterium bauzanense]|uniref:Putative outer membrane starch-binding protein n=1 Tax=Albibacterium bauzanense TaxID=653929 RepID=A0A4V6NF08_9SPHI|nr:RagB/SusD family nutrient uptake outer membrane protein [Albibacterium bauzanense]TCK80591.1 putative outer membrane starch-binding protein [Albibacterium bauzanense]
MKNIFIKGLSTFMVPLLMLTSCTKLDEDVYSVYTDKNFPSTPEQYAVLTGPIYVAAQKFFDNNYFDLQSTGTDEVLIPARGGDWFDGGKWKVMHYHEWTASHELMKNSWNWGFGAIATCNRILKSLESAPESPEKERTFAEIKIMRAWYYYSMLDAFGNIPIVTTFDDKAEAPSQSSRAEVFEFVVGEIEANVDLLSEDVNATTYGRPTKWMAHTLLAKIYLNAEVYAGKTYWNKVVEHSDAVIGSNAYTLSSSANYFDMFSPTNGPANKEIIWAIPFDAQKATGNWLFKKMLHSAHRYTFGLQAGGWNGWCTQPAFLDSYDDDDIRKKQWLYGQQYNEDGTPLVFNGVNIVLDPYYFPAYDVGGADNLGKLAGARNIKYAPDKNALGNNANNDVVIYRYSDIYMMRAEAILRGATNGTMAEAISNVNLIRGRAFNDDPSKLYTTLTLKDIYDERGREFSLEMTRRTDMIRFGTFADPQLFKGKTDFITEKLFPIPSTARASNPNLDQNPGYN